MQHVLNINIKIYFYINSPAAYGGGGIYITIYYILFTFSVHAY
jgi:hypothetical protein